jgi:hypothetical protein
MSDKFTVTPSDSLLDARAAVRALEAESVSLPRQMRAAAIEEDHAAFGRLQMAEQSLPARTAEAERRLMALELEYARQCREAALAKREDGTQRVLKASEQRKAAELEERLGRGQREAAQDALSGANKKIRELEAKAARVGMTAEPAALA